MVFTVAIIGSAAFNDNAVKNQFLHKNIQFIRYDIDNSFEYQNLDNNISAFLVDATDSDKSTLCLAALRQDHQFSSHLIYLLDHHHILAEKETPKTAEQLLEQLHQWLGRKKQLRLIDNSLLKNRIIQYLWLNKSRTIEAEKDISMPKGYRFPLLDSWSEGDIAGKMELLNKQCDAGVLQKIKLSNRTRSCSKCDSSSLNVIDTCPSCKAIDIVTEQALHCFTCGHVGQEQAFQRNNRITCPNCLTQLRHIGTDYDRPIENIRCNSCHNLSINSEAIAQCFSCNHDNDLSRLSINNFHQYQLDINGINLAQSGAVAQVLPTDLRDSVSKDHLSWLLNWLVHSPTPNQSIFHRLIKIRVDNYSELLQEKSEVILEGFLQEFRTRLLTLLGENNTFCHAENDVWLYIFPFCDEKNIDDFSQGLQQICDDILGNPIDVSVVVYDLVEKEGDGKMLSWINRIVEQR